MGKKNSGNLEKLMVSMSASLATITTKLSTMEELLNTSLEENKQLKAELADKNNIIGDMSCKINMLHNSPNINRVTSVFDPTEQILKQT